MDDPNYIAIAATFISLCALGTSLYGAHLSRKHNKLSVKPKLDILSHNHIDSGTNKHTFKITIINNGLGPAIINKIIYSKNNIPYKDGQELEEDINDLKDKLNTEDTYEEYHINGRTIKEGESINIIKLTFTATDSKQKIFEDFFENCEINIIYLSMYEEELTITSKYEGDNYNREVAHG